MLEGSIMKSRSELHEELKAYYRNYYWIGLDKYRLCEAVYFQPPENVKLEYPCIIYRRSIDKTLNANDKNYFYMNQYELTVIEKDPEVPLATRIIKDFNYASILNRYTIDNLYHTIIRLYY